MKDKVYRIVVDVWRLAAQFGFRKMGSADWEAFVAGAERLVKGCRDRDTGDAAAEALCRDLLDAFQSFYQRIRKQQEMDHGGQD